MDRAIEADEANMPEDDHSINEELSEFECS
jgi:hypothetical protein